MRISSALRMANKTYNDAINALNSLQSNYANIMAVRESGVRKNEMAILEMVEWTRRIGYTTADFNKLNIVHITGTKGKGSTAAFTNSILDQYKDKLHNIGLYTSPHLRSVRERIRINGQPLSEEKFTKYFYDIWNKLDNTTSPVEKFPHMTPGAKPGYFKFLTLLSFHTFLQEGCRSCVYEVGIGGEYDSTNIIEKPVACGVALLGIDHTFMLGETIDEIAWNKGGIFKPHSPAYTIEDQPVQGMKVLEERASERDTTVAKVPTFNQLNNVKLGIAGNFQKTNASLAVALASEALFSMGLIQNRVNLEADAQLPTTFIEGLERTQWEGRCQTIKRGNNFWYLDGAHTKDSIEAASGWFSDVVEDSPRKKVLLFNQQSRDAKALIHYAVNKISPKIKFDHVIFTTNVTWGSGSYSADLVSMNTCKEDVEALKVQKDLAEEWKNIDPKSEISITPSIESANELIEGLQDGPLDIYVCGSLHLVGGLLVVFDGK